MLQKMTGMDELEDQVTSMEKAFEDRMLTLEELFCQTFIEFCNSLREEFARLCRKAK
jgi:hypothetical protein